MKIGIDISPVFRQRGGVGTYTFHLVKALLDLKTDHTFFLYSTERANDSVPFLDKPHVHFVYGGKTCIQYRIWKENIDVVHGPNFRLPGNGMKGNVLTIHDLALVKFPAFGKKRFGAKLSFWRTRRRALSADRIIADSINTLHDVIEFIGVSREKISVIPMGVDPFYFPDHNQDLFTKTLEKYSIKKRQFILFAGTIEPRKNVAALIQAYARSKKLRESYAVVLAGSPGWGYQEIEQVIRKGNLEEDVHVTGYLPAEELRSLYSFASCFVFPSIYEGFGIPPLEAMACGTPVICSNSSSLPEVVGDAALMVDPYDIGGLSAGMEKVLDDVNLRGQLIQKGLSRVNKFSWERTARGTLQVYEKLFLSGSSSP